MFSQHSCGAISHIYPSIWVRLVQILSGLFDIREVTRATELFNQVHNLSGIALIYVYKAVKSETGLSVFRGSNKLNKFSFSTGGEIRFFSCIFY